ncbi:MAG: hypothetical protein ACTSWG_13140 [Candidatus Helarchaeota archaeon]
MSKVIVIDTSSLFVPAVKVYNRQLKDLVDKKRLALSQELGEEVKNWTCMDFLQEIKARNEMPFIMMPHQMYFNSLLSCLKKIGVEKDTKVIMALEGRSFRKDYLFSYKRHRKDQRDADECVDWTEEFARCNRLHDKLNEATNWYFLRSWIAECDDIAAVCCRYFKDNSVIIVTGDKDLHQLLFYPNVKIFNTNKKINGSKGVYETTVKNPLKIISDKVRLGDRSDGILVNKEIDTINDVELREFLVNLLELPDFVEKSIIEMLQNLKPKKENLDLLPFKNSKEKFFKIYDKDKIITYNYCKELMEKRKNRKSKKAKEKREQKKRRNNA